MDEKAHYKAGLFIYLEHGASRASPWYLHVFGGIRRSSFACQRRAIKAGPLNKGKKKLTAKPQVLLYRTNLTHHFVIPIMRLG